MQESVANSSFLVPCLCCAVSSRFWNFDTCACMWPVTIKVGPVGNVSILCSSCSKLGADHPTTITRMINLASAYCNQDRWAEAEKLFVQVMQTSKSKGLGCWCVHLRCGPAEFGPDASD